MTRAAHASAARIATPPVAAPDHERARMIGVHLTPWWPGMAHVAVGDRRRWRDHHSTPARVLRGALRSLDRGPAEVRLTLEANREDVGVWTVPPATAEIRDLPEASGEVLIAILHTGVSVSEAEAVIAALRAEGWSPKPQPLFAED